jgi:ABC-type Na+ efflux pump permease subunit
MADTVAAKLKPVGLESQLQIEFILLCIAWNVEYIIYVKCFVPNTILSVSAHLPVYLSIYLSIYLSVCLSICLSSLCYMCRAFCHKLN